jgi:hypothetical protein
MHDLKLTSIRFWVLALALIPFVFLLAIFGVFWRLESQTESAGAVAQRSDDVLEQSHRLQTSATPKVPFAGIFFSESRKPTPTSLELSPPFQPPGAN